MTTTEKPRRNLIFAIAIGIGLIGVLIAWYFEHVPNIAESRIFFWWFVFNIGGVIIGFIFSPNGHEMNLPAYYIATFAQWFVVFLLVFRIWRKRKSAGQIKTK
jgi:hypothetical protein